MRCLCVRCVCFCLFPLPLCYYCFLSIMFFFSLFFVSSLHPSAAVFFFFSMFLFLYFLAISLLPFSASSSSLHPISNFSSFFLHFLLSFTFVILRRSRLSFHLFHYFPLFFSLFFPFPLTCLSFSFLLQSLLPVSHSLLLNFLFNIPPLFPSVTSSFLPSLPSCFSLFFPFSASYFSFTLFHPSLSFPPPLLSFFPSPYSITLFHPSLPFPPHSFFLFSTLSFLSHSSPPFTPLSVPFSYTPYSSIPLIPPFPLLPPSPHKRTAHKAVL